MDRLKTKTGGDSSTWIFNIHSAFKWVQDFIDTHIKKFFIGFFKTSGVFYDGSEDKLEGDAVKNGDSIDLTVEAGMGSTDTGELIKLTTQGTKNIAPFPGDGTYYLYLEYDTPDDNTSNYDIPRIPNAYDVIKGRTMDSYLIKFESSWGGSDIIKIATVIISGGAVTTPITDSRIMATFFGIPSAGILWINDNYDVAGDDGFDKTGTTKDNFKVALGAQTEANLMIEFIPKSPIGIRVHDLNPHHGQADSAIGKLHLKWNWTNLIWDFDTGKFIEVTGGDGDNLLDVIADELIGYYVYCIDFTSEGNKYLIVGNAATVTGTTSIELEDAYAGETYTNKANIVCGGSQIIVKRIRHDGEDDPVPEDGVLSYFDIDRDINNETIVNVQLGQYESIWMAAGRFGLQSVWTQMASIAGTDSTYDPDQGTSEPGPQDPVVYLDGTPNSTVMMHMDLPSINPTLPNPAAIELIATAAGFRIEVSGWFAINLPDKQPHEYEVIYTTVGPNVDWTDNTAWADHFFAKGRVIQVAVAVRDTYYVSIRPIQNKQIICDTGDEVHGVIMSGGAGQAPNDHPVIENIPFKIFTFSGTLATAVDTDWYPLTDPVSPCVGDDASTAVGGVENLEAAVNHQIMGHVMGSVLIDSAFKEFNIVEGRVKSTQMQFKLEPLDGSSTPTTGTTSKINTTKAGRYVAELTKITAEYVMTRVVANIKKALTVTPSDPGIIYMKHETTGGEFHTAEIEYPNSYVEQGMDLMIVGAESERNISVSLFDPDIGDPNNVCSITGNLTIYGRQRRVTITTGDSGYIDRGKFIPD